MLKRMEEVLVCKLKRMSAHCEVRQVAAIEALLCCNQKVIVANARLVANASCAAHASCAASASCALHVSVDVWHKCTCCLECPVCVERITHARAGIILLIIVRTLFHCLVLSHQLIRFTCEHCAVCLAALHIVCESALCLSTCLCLCVHISV